MIMIGSIGYKFNLVALVLCLLSINVRSESVTILNWSPTAFPGDIVYVQGESFGSSPEVLISGPNHAEVVAKIVSSDPISVSIIQFVIPNDWYLEAYLVKVRNNGVTSDAVIMNRPHCQQFDVYEVLPGKQMKIYGENLYFGSSRQPRVYLVKQGTDTKMEATIDFSQSDENLLTITTPNDLESDTTYQILIDNGLGATSPAKMTVTARVGKDYLNIGLGWGVNFGFIEKNIVTLNASTDTSYDAFPDIQNAINQISQQGGGLLMLSEGDFYWRSCKSLQLHGNIVIKGAGVNRTTIYSGYCNISGSWIYSSDASLSNFAILDMSFRPGDFDQGGFYGNAISGPNFSNIVLARVYWDLKGSRFSFTGTNVLIQDFVAVSKSIPLNGYSSGFAFGCMKYGIFRNVWLYFENGYMTSSFMKYSVLENFHLIRDSSKQFIPEGPIQSRMWSCNFCENIVAEKSQFETLNFNFSKDNNDGETILTEGGGPKRGEFDVGVVSSATATTLTVLNANWTLQTTDMLSLTITDGPGFGQTRRLLSATTDTITVDEPWTVLPTSQSKYSLVTPGFMNWLIKDTLFKGNPRGIFIYASAGINVTIVGNTFVNGAGIGYIPYQRAYDSTAIDRCGSSQLQIPYYQQQITQVYKSRILNNNLYADDPNANAQIRLTGIQLSFQDTFTRGTIMFGIEVRGNNVTRVGQQVSTLPSYMTAMCFQSQVGLPNATLTSVVGTIMQGNHAQDVPLANGFGSNIGGSVLACQSVTGRVSQNDTLSFGMNTCWFYPSQTTDVHVLADQCRSVNYLPPSPTPSQTPQSGQSPSTQPSTVSVAAITTLSVVGVVLLLALAI